MERKQRLKKTREEARSLATQFFLSLSRRYHVITMIHVNLRRCNIFSGKEEKKSSEWIDLYTRFILTLNLFHLECNNCHRREGFTRHGYYTRGYVLDACDLDKSIRIRILRVKCKHCGCTHAILPEEIVPYLKYTTTFINTALERHYVKGESVEDVCWDLNIDTLQLYRWKKQFQQQKEQYLGVLESRKLSAKDVMARLTGLKEYVTEFAEGFLLKIGKMPMQKHRNPPNTKLPVFS